MKKIVSLLLIVGLFLTGCSSTKEQKASEILIAASENMNKEKTSSHVTVTVDNTVDGVKDSIKVISTMTDLDALGNPNRSYMLFEYLGKTIEVYTIDEISYMILGDLKIMLTESLGSIAPFDVSSFDDLTSAFDQSSASEIDTYFTYTTDKVGNYVLTMTGDDEMEDSYKTLIEEFAMESIKSVSNPTMIYTVDSNYNIIEILVTSDYVDDLDTAGSLSVRIEMNLNDKSLSVDEPNADDFITENQMTEADYTTLFEYLYGFE